MGATLNAAYALRAADDRGSIDPGKRGDLTILSVDHPEELCLAVGQNVVSEVVIGGEVVHSAGLAAPQSRHRLRRPMVHKRIRPFNTRDTYPEQTLDNDLAQAVVAGNIVFLRGQVGQDLDTAENVGHRRRRRRRPSRR